MYQDISWSFRVAFQIVNLFLIKKNSLKESLLLKLIILNCLKEIRF